MRRVVYDTMLFYQAAAQSPPRLHGSFQAIDARKVQLCMSQELFDEIVAVLTRTEFRVRAPHFSSAIAALFFAKIRTVSIWFDQVPHAFTLPAHAKDDHLLNLVITSEADRLVTWEDRLLKLEDPASHDGNRLRVFAPKLRIVTPKALVTELQ